MINIEHSIDNQYFVSVFDTDEEGFEEWFERVNPEWAVSEIYWSRGIPSCMCLVYQITSKDEFMLHKLRWGGNLSWAEFHEGDTAQKIRDHYLPTLYLIRNTEDIREEH